jgi:hypothetical protein
LAPHHVRDSERHALGPRYIAKCNPTTERPWLDALKGLEEKAAPEGKSRTNTALSSMDDISKAPVHRGDKSAKSPAPSPNGEGTSANIRDVKAKESQRILVTTQDQLAEVIAHLRDVGLVALDLETTGLDPRGDCVRLLSLATKDATHIVDCQGVDPAELFPILIEATMVAHNALFDLGFLSSLGVQTRQGSGHHAPLPVAPRGSQS